MININLLPPQLKMQRIMAKRNASLISICLVIILVVAIIGIIARSFESTMATYLKSTKENIEKNTSQLDQYQDLQDLALLINDRWQAAQVIDKDRPFWSQILRELSNCAPADVQFENLTANIEKTPNFILQGNTTSEREIIKFKEKLEDSGFFNNVNFKSSSISSDQSGQTAVQENGRVKFTLEFDLEQEKVESNQ